MMPTYLATARLPFLVLATAALAVHFFLFQLRYGWYLKPDEFRLLLIGYLLCFCAILFLWLRFPSRFLVATVGLVAFVFPPVLFGENFVAVDVKFSVFVIFSLLLFVGATELRRRMGGNKI
jgi:hypothetical protein